MCIAVFCYNCRMLFLVLLCSIIDKWYEFCFYLSGYKYLLSDRIVSILSAFNTHSTQLIPHINYISPSNRRKCHQPVFFWGGMIGSIEDQLYGYKRKMYKELSIMIVQSPTIRYIFKWWHPLANYYPGNIEHFPILLLN